MKITKGIQQITKLMTMTNRSKADLASRFQRRRSLLAAATTASATSPCLLWRGHKLDDMKISNSTNVAAQNLIDAAVDDDHDGNMQKHISKHEGDITTIWNN